MLLKVHYRLPFTELQKALNVTSGNLNSHITKLSKIGLVEISKKFVELKPRTIITITKQGKERLNNYTDTIYKFLQSFIDS